MQLMAVVLSSVREVSASTEEETRDVYAHFGLALYLAQCLEHGLANALVAVDLVPRSARNRPSREKWFEDFDDFLGTKFRATLGRLIEDVRRVTPVSSELEATLGAALRCRNWLAHHYFRERAEAFVTKAGRAAMLLELREAQELFLKADQLLFDETRPIRERFGLTDEILAEWAARYASEVMSSE